MAFPNEIALRIIADAGIKDQPTILLYLLDNRVGHIALVEEHHGIFSIGETLRNISNSHEIFDLKQIESN